MTDLLTYGKLISSFIRKMTSPEIGQFRLEISTFRIILERARIENPKLVKFSITDSGEIVNNLKDEESSLKVLSSFLQKSLDFISSLIGEELARDIISSAMKDEISDLSTEVRGREILLEHIPEPFKTALIDAMEKREGTSDHEEIINLFQEVIQAYLKDLSTHTDLSAFKLKLSIMREKFTLLKYVELSKDNSIKIDKERWASAEQEDVRMALAALFNSMVGLSTFLLGKEEAVKKASRVFQYYFDGKDELLEKYHLQEDILDGALNMKVSTGVEVLDMRMGGGIPKGASILLISPSGIERDIFISNLLNKGLNNGSSALMVLSKEPPRSIRMLLRSNGLDPDELEEEGRFRIVDWFSWRGERIIGVERDGHALKSSKILSNLGIAINKGLRELTYSTTKVGIIHIIGPATNIFEFNQVYNFIQRLRAKFKDDEMASIFLLEKDSLSKDLESRIQEIFDGTLEINKEMVKGKFQREMVIRSLSGVDFDANPLPFQIRDNMIIPEGSEIEDLQVPKPPKKPTPIQQPRVEVEETPISKDDNDIRLEEDLVPELPELEEMEEIKEEIPETKLKVKRMIKRRIKEQPKGNDLIDQIKTSPNEKKVTPQKKVRLLKRKIIRKGPKNSEDRVTIDPDLEGMDLGFKKNDPKEVLYEALENIDELLENEDIFSSSEKKKKTLN